MLPEPTLPKRRRSAPAPPQPWAMTPLFAVPDSTLRSNDDTPCDLDIYGMTATKGEH